MSKHQEILSYLEELPVGKRVSVRSISNHLGVSDGTAYRAIKEAELGYFLRKDAWSQGFMTEVVRKICQLSFEEFGLKQLSIITHLENESSQRVALKSGFRLIRQFKGSDRYTRKMRDYLEFRYVKGEFNE